MRKITEEEYRSLFKQKMIDPVPMIFSGLRISKRLRSCVTRRCKTTARRVGFLDEYGQRIYRHSEKLYWLTDHEFFLGYKGVHYSNRCPIIFSFPYIGFHDLNRNTPDDKLSSKCHILLVNPRYIDYVHYDNQDMTTMCLAIVPEFPNWKQQLWLIEEAVGDEVFFSYGDSDE